MNKICFGCGAKLQSDDKELIGYIPETKFKDSSYCQRCFKLTNYGEISHNAVPKKAKTIVNSINKDDKFVVFLTDILSINSEIIDIFHSIRTSKVLIISKSDIIPKNVKESMIVKFLKDYYQVTEDIKFVSSENNYGVEALSKYLFKRNINVTYIVGLSNSGKSTLINKLLVKNHSKIKKITTSHIPNTTMDFIRIKINDDLTIIDSPGFVIPTIKNDVLIEKNKMKNFITPRTYQMKKDETLMIEDIYLNFSEKTSVTLYVSNSIIIKKYFKPVTFDDEIIAYDNGDLVINGLGFINIKQKCTIKTSNLDTNITEVRKSIFGDNYE